MEDSYVTQSLDILNLLQELDEHPAIKMLTAIKHLNALGHLNLEATLGILFPNVPTNDLRNSLALFVSGYLVAVQADVPREVIERVIQGKMEVAQHLVIYPANSLGGSFSFTENKAGNELRVARCFAYMEAASQHRTLEGETLHAQTQLENKSSSRL